MSDRRQFRDLVSPEVARVTLDALDLDPGTESVQLTQARDRILAERIDAEIDVPGFDRSNVDGYAVQAADTFGADEANPVTLSVVGVVHAGEQPSATVDSGTAVELSTGAVLPPGADAVVMVEQTSKSDGSLSVRTSVAPGANVMRAGDDIAAGTRALGPGTRLTAREIGLLSALGIDSVPVHRRPTVGIVSTGDELVRPGNPVDSSSGEIHDVNSYTIASAVEAAGGEPVLYPHVGDDYEEMERMLLAGAEECDLVLSSGSTSASAVDVIYRVIEQRGDLQFHGVAVKPGKPMLVGELGGAAYVGLPGFPVSALTIFRTFVAPILRQAAGRQEPETATVSGHMAVRERYGEGRRRLLPVGLVTDGDDENLVYPVDKGSGATTSLVEADGFVSVPAETAYLAAGEQVDVTLFSPEVRPPTVLCVGEADPLFSRLLDGVARPRFLPIGTRDGLRRLRDGIPDVAVVIESTTSDGETVELGSWSREWGLIVSPDNPMSIEGVVDLVERDIQFVNRERGSGLRDSLDSVLEELATSRDVTLDSFVDAITGYEFTTSGLESPARRVSRGDAAAGLGLRATASTLDLGFVPVGSQSVTVYADVDRREKPGVQELAAAVESAATIAHSLDGFEAG